MAVTTGQTNPTGVGRIARGYQNGTYTAADVTLQVGFTVREFQIINVTDGLTQRWFEGMNSGDYLELVRVDGATTSHNTLETDDSIVVNQGGVAGEIFIDVSVGNIITDNDTVVWVAYG